MALILDQKRPVPCVGYRVRSIHPQHENEYPCLFYPDSETEFLQGGDAVKLVDGGDKGVKYTVVDKAEAGDTIYGVVITNFWKKKYVPGSEISIANRGVEVWYLASEELVNGTLVSLVPDAEFPTVTVSTGSDTLGRVTIASSTYTDENMYVGIEVDPLAFAATSGTSVAMVRQIVNEKDSWYPITSTYQVQTNDLQTRFQAVGGSANPEVDLDLTLITPTPALTYALSNNTTKDSLIVTTLGNFLVSPGSIGAIQYNSTTNEWTESVAQ